MFYKLTAFYGQQICSTIPACYTKRLWEKTGMAVSEKICVSATFGKSVLSHGAENNWSPLLSRDQAEAEKARGAQWYTSQQPSQRRLAFPGETLLKKSVYFKPAQTSLCSVKARNKKGSEEFDFFFFHAMMVAYSTAWRKIDWSCYASLDKDLICRWVRRG